MTDLHKEVYRTLNSANEPLKLTELQTRLGDNEDTRERIAAIVRQKDKFKKVKKESGRSAYKIDEKFH